jgi:hypothetical protein
MSSSHRPLQDSRYAYQVPSLEIGDTIQTRKAIGLPEVAVKESKRAFGEWACQVSTLTFECG